PFTVTVPNLPFGSGGLISISVQRLTCPRQHPRGPATRLVSGQLSPAAGGGASHGAAVSCRLSAAGIRFLGILFPPGSSALLTVGLPGRCLDPGRVSTFRTSKSRPDWVPSFPRGPAVLSQPVRSLRPPLAPICQGPGPIAPACIPSPGAV